MPDFEKRKGEFRWKMEVSRWRGVWLRLSHHRHSIGSLWGGGVILLWRSLHLFLPVILTCVHTRQNFLTRTRINFAFKFYPHCVAWLETSISVSHVREQLQEFCFRHSFPTRCATSAIIEWDSSLIELHGNLTCDFVPGVGTLEKYSFFAGSLRQWA